ncbi:GumC family protein, partial [Thermodesulfobacteriota bacterium]
MNDKNNNWPSDNGPAGETLPVNSNGAWGQPPIDMRLLSPPPDLNLESHKSLLEYLRQALHRKWTIGLVFTIVVALAAWHAYKAKPIFLSRATIEIQKEYPSSANMPELFAFFGHFDLYYQTQLVVLTSPGVAQGYLKLADQKALLEKATSGADVPRAATTDQQAETESPVVKTKAQQKLERERKRAAQVSGVLGSVSVSPIKQTRLINIEMTAGGPVEAREKLRTYLRAYMEQNQRKRGELGSRVRSLLKAELAEAEKQMTDAQTELVDFTRKHELITSGKVTGEGTHVFKQSVENLVKSKDERVKLEAMAFAREDVLPNQIRDEYLAQLKGQLADLKSQLTTMEGIYSSDYVKVVSLKRRIDTMEKAVAEIEDDSVSSNSSLTTATPRPAISP